MIKHRIYANAKVEMWSSNCTGMDSEKFLDGGLNKKCVTKNSGGCARGVARSGIRKFWWENVVLNEVEC